MISGKRNAQYLNRERHQGFTIVELLIVVVVIAVLAAISLVAYNGITGQAKSAAKAQEIAQWKRKAEVHKAEKGIACPENYVFVYGNLSLGTNDFCVMKYEAKNVGGVATSQASGTPWVSINQTDAITAASAAGGHLITEAEWMTIAADVLSVKHNWSGGEAGSGYIYQGYVAGGSVSTLSASSDDNDGLHGITGGTGNTSGTNSQRTLLLSSGDTIWDFSGNVWEWTQQAIGISTHTVSQIGYSGDVGSVCRDYTFGGLSLGNLPIASRPVSLAGVEGLGDVVNWGRIRGVGSICYNYEHTNARAFSRGGGWDDEDVAGVLALSLTRTASHSSMYLGFRVAR